MPRRVLIIPDKFKGTLDARRVGAAIRRGWLKERPADQVTVIPMSDGGDGFGAVLSSLMRARRKSVATMDAAHQPCLSDWWWEPRSRTAILECAKTVGLAMLS